MSNIIIREYIKHNEKNFSNKFEDEKSKILIEFNGWSNAHIWISYLANCLAKKHNSSICAYEGYTLISSPLNQNLFKKIKYILAKSFFGKYYKIFKSFGVNKFIRPEISKDIEKKSNKEFKKIKKIKSKKKILDFKINKVLLGDLIYDTYLKNNNVCTIHLNDERFWEFFHDCIKLYFFWSRYFNNNPIKSLIIVHPTYLYGMLMRIATSKKIPVYRATYNQITYISKNNYHMGKDFINFPKIFKSFEEQKKKKFLNLAREKLEHILNYKKIIKFKQKSNKISIMIAMHNFYDSPHVFGNMLFSDFFEWLNYLVKLSVKTDYEWYLKTHPDNNEEDIKIVSKILNENNNIKILSAEDDYIKVLKKGINFVLTCYGSVGYEYSYLGCTVINACKENPHSKYKFNLNPKSINQYKKIIMNISKYKIKPNKKKILELFFLRKIYFISNWLSVDIKLSEKFGWKKGIYKPSMYKIWMEQWNIKKHNEIVDKINNFINSKKFRLFKTDL
jgi:hypothetical protein